VILGYYSGKSHNLIGLGIFHGDLKFFYLHEKSRDLSNYEIFPHKILESRTFKKSSILIVIILDAPCICWEFALGCQLNENSKLACIGVH
jgi:hypothetical protein